MTTPTHRACGHLASGPDGFPCPHPKCWASGALAVVSLVDGSEELYERVLFSPASSAAFFGWRKAGETLALGTPSEARAAVPVMPPRYAPTGVQRDGVPVYRCKACDIQSVGVERAVEHAAIHDTSDPRLEPIPPFGMGAMAAVERNTQRLEAKHVAQGAEMANAIAAHLRSEAVDSSREHLKAHQDVQRAAKKGKKP